MNLTAPHTSDGHEPPPIHPRAPRRTLFALAAACGADSRPAPGTCEADCAACVADLEVWLGTLVEEGEAGLVARPRDLDLVELPAGRPFVPLQTIPSIAVGREEISFWALTSGSRAPTHPTASAPR